MTRTALPLGRREARLASEAAIAPRDGGLEQAGEAAGQLCRGPCATSDHPEAHRRRPWTLVPNTLSAAETDAPKPACWYTTGPTRE